MCQILYTKLLLENVILKFITFVFIQTVHKVFYNMSFKNVNNFFTFCKEVLYTPFLNRHL